MNYNSVLNLSHYAEFTPPLTNRKSWEHNMTMRAFRDFGVLRPDAQVLGVGVGREKLIYSLSNHVQWVFATDLYLTPGRWYTWHDPAMLTDPASQADAFVSLDPFKAEHIIPLHMDGRSLRFPDNSMDGVFSSGSIEHFGDYETFPHWEDVTQAACEMARVLKPGGILSLSTEFKLAGAGWGWDNVRLFDPDDLRRYIIEPSHLTPVDDLQTACSDDTRAVSWSLYQFNTVGSPPVECVVTYDEFVFTSVHLALRKEA